MVTSRRSHLCITVQDINPLNFDAEAVSRKVADLAAWEPCYGHLEALLGTDLVQPLWEWCQSLKARLHQRLSEWIAECERVIKMHADKVAMWSEPFSITSTYAEAQALQAANTLLQQALFDFDKARWSSSVAP